MAVSRPYSMLIYIVSPITKKKKKGGKRAKNVKIKLRTTLPSAYCLKILPCLRGRKRKKMKEENNWAFCDSRCDGASV